MESTKTITSRQQRRATLQLCIPRIPNQEFANFPELPLELRLTIWRLAQPGPRILDVFRLKDNCQNAWDHRFNRYKSFHTHPTLLVVCRESRVETLKSYTMIRAAHGFALAFNPKTDVVHAYFGRGIDALHPNIFRKEPFTCLGRHVPRIKRMAIDESMLDSFQKTNTERESLVWLTLEEICIILSPRASLQWPNCLNAEQTRTLELDMPVGVDEGWGNAQLQNSFLHTLQRVKQRLVSDPSFAQEHKLQVGTGENENIKLPTVKVVQWGMLGNKKDPFCVPITALSLRK